MELLTFLVLNQKDFIFIRNICTISSYIEHGIKWYNETILLYVGWNRACIVANPTIATAEHIQY